jgi:hypothetical protein
LSKLKFEDLDALNGCMVFVSLLDSVDTFKGILETIEGTKFYIIDEYGLYWELDMVEVKELEEISL